MADNSSGGEMPDEFINAVCKMANAVMLQR
jgi:hypothetical protein